MAENENETPTAVAEQPVEAAQQEFQYDIQVEEIGPATKKVTVDIPQERIAQLLGDQFKELRREAAIPGFRPGHAPAKLIEKRFSSDVREQVRRNLISESYQQAVQRHSLEVMGEPELDESEEAKLPETGNYKYSVTVEIQPPIVLPPLTGLKVRKPKVSVTDEHIEQAMTNLRQQNGGALVPVEDRGVEAGDFLLADVHVKHEGNVISHQHDSQLVARKGVINGIPIDDLAEKLAGLKTGEKREVSVRAPASHPDPAIADKDVQIEIELKDIKRLELPEVNQEFLDQLGFNDVAELREALKERMVEQLEYDVQQAMREQVNNYLVQNVQMELPAKLSDRQAARVLSRQTIDLMTRGLPAEQIKERLASMSANAKEEAGRELKLFFILQKVAASQNVDVSEGELNSRVATLAAQQGSRPEKLKQEMAKDGTLANLYVQMREQKAIDKILETAQVEEVELPKAGENA